MVDKNGFEKLKKLFFEESSKDGLFKLSSEDIDCVKMSFKSLAKLNQYLKKINQSSKEARDLRKNINYLRKIILSLYTSRMNKIINNISTYIRSMDVKSFFETERVLLRCIKVIMNTYKDYIKKSVNNLEYPDHRDLQITIVKNLMKSLRIDVSDLTNNGKVSKVNILLFEKDLPKIAAPDGKTYGPFAKGDIVIMRKENELLIQNLVAKGYAKILK